MKRRAKLRRPARFKRTSQLGEDRSAAHAAASVPKVEASVGSDPDAKGAVTQANSGARFLVTMHREKDLKADRAGLDPALAPCLR